jgi:hypothetical protein
MLQDKSQVTTKTPREIRNSDLFLVVSMDLFQAFEFPLKYRIPVPMGFLHLGESDVVVITNYSRSKQKQSIASRLLITCSSTLIPAFSSPPFIFTVSSPPIARNDPFKFRR